MFNPARGIAAAAVLLIALAGCATADATEPTPAPSTTPTVTATPSPTTASPSPTVVDDGGYDAGFLDGSQADVFMDPVPDGHSPEYGKGWAAAQKAQDEEVEEYMQAQKKALKPYIKDLREGWPKQTKPYTDEELGDAIDSQCSVYPSDYWDLKAWNKGRLKDAKDMGIKNETLRHAILGQAAGNSGYCDYS